VTEPVPWRRPTAVGPLRRSGPPSPDAIRLNANECPFPPPPPVVAAMADAATNCHRYSFGSEGPLLSALAEWLGVPTSRIVLTNGSNELLDRLIGALGEPGREIVYPHPSFPLFSSAAANSGATPVPIPLAADGTNDLEAMAAAVTDRTSLVIVCNPNNPTGGHLPADVVGSFLDSLPAHPLILLDEAYVEFTAERRRGSRSGLDLLDRHPHALSVRTFSKYFGLAGLRVGYGVAQSDDLAAEIRVRLSPAGLSQVALAGALASLQHREVAEERLALLCAERDHLAAGLADLGLEPWPTSTNFVLCRDPRPDTVARLAEEGLWIRSGESVLFPGTIRISVGHPEANARVLTAMEKILAGAA